MKLDFLKSLNEVTEKNDDCDDEKKLKKKNKTDISAEEEAANIIKRSQLDETNNFFQDINDNNGLDKSNSNNIESRTGLDRTTVKIPKDVMDAVNARKSELKSSAELFDNKGYNDNSMKLHAIECIDKIVELINNDEENSFDGIKSAQVYFGTLMGPLMDLLPAKLIKFITTGK